VNAGGVLLKMAVRMIASACRSSRGFAPRRGVGGRACHHRHHLRRAGTMVQPNLKKLVAYPSVSHLASWCSHLRVS